MRVLEHLADAHFQHCRCHRKQHRSELMEWYARVAVSIDADIVAYHCPTCQRPTSEPVLDFSFHETDSSLVCGNCLTELGQRWTTQAA